jgi:hypothetical protein
MGYFNPVVTPRTDWAPIPRMQIDFNTLLGGTEKITVWRRSDGRLWRVRGAINIQASGGVSVTDFEAPFNVQSEYFAEMFAADGRKINRTESTVATLRCNDMVWHNPLDPKTYVVVDWTDTALREVSRPQSGVVHRAQGRSVGVLVADGVRQGVTGVSLDITIDNAEMNRRFTAMFTGYDVDVLPITCIRHPGPMNFPRTFFASILDPREVALTVQYGGSLTQWKIDSDEVAPPAEGRIIPLLTYADFNAFFATYAEFNAYYPTYQAANTDYTKADVV